MRYYDHDPQVDFTAAMHFVRLFAQRVLQSSLPPDVDVLKVDVPAVATPATPWRVTRQDRLSYYTPEPPALRRPLRWTRQDHERRLPRGATQQKTRTPAPWRTASFRSRR